MEFSISYRGAPVGTGSTAPERGGVRVTARCRVCTDAVLRLYGVGPGARTIRIGVLEPDAGGLSLTRLLTYETLRTAGYAPDALPETYELSDGMAAVRPAALPEPAEAAPAPPLASAPADEAPAPARAALDPLAPIPAPVGAGARGSPAAHGRRAGGCGHCRRRADRRADGGRGPRLLPVPPGRCLPARLCPDCLHGFRRMRRPASASL